MSHSSDRRAPPTIQRLDTPVQLNGSASNSPSSATSARRGVRTKKPALRVRAVMPVVVGPGDVWRTTLGTPESEMKTLMVIVVTGLATADMKSKSWVLRPLLV